MECYFPTFGIDKCSHVAVFFVDECFGHDDRTSIGLDSAEDIAKIVTCIEIHQRARLTRLASFARYNRSAYANFFHREERHFVSAHFRGLEFNAQNCRIEFHRTVNIGRGNFEPVNRISHDTTPKNCVIMPQMHLAFGDDCKITAAY
jgi:hypothetical protein